MEGCRKTLGYASKKNSPVPQKGSFWPALILLLHSALLQILACLEASLLSYSLTQNQKCVTPKQVKYFQVTYAIQVRVCTRVQYSLSVEISTAGVVRAGVRAPFGPLAAFCTVAVRCLGMEGKPCRAAQLLLTALSSTSYSSGLLSI